MTEQSTFPRHPLRHIYDVRTVIATDDVAPATNSEAKPSPHDLPFNIGLELTWHMDEDKSLRDVPDKNFRCVTGFSMPEPPNSAYHVGTREDVTAGELRNKILSRAIDIRLYRITGTAYLDHELYGLRVGRNEIEIKSPPTFRRDLVEKYYKAYYKLFSTDLGLSIVSNLGQSGGGHIHFSKRGKEWSGKELAHIFTHTANRPWFNWIFNEPNDDCNANSIFNEINKRIESTPQEPQEFDVLEYARRQYEERRQWHIDRGENPDLTNSYRVRRYVLAWRDAQQWRRTPPTPNSILYSVNDKHTYALGKDYAITYSLDYGTLELRFFDAARNWKEQAAMLDFGVAWLSYLIKQHEDGIPRESLDMNREPTSNKQFDKTIWTKKRVVGEFHELLDTLGLDKDRYKVFINRNLSTRYGDEFTLT